MSRLHESRLRWRAFLKRRQLDRDLEDEIQFHLEMKTRSHRAAGMTSQEAFYAARREFGNLSRWKEDIRAMWSMGTVERVVQDMRYALRSLRKAPALTAAAILVLAVGIGSTTAIFSMVNAVLLRSLPFQTPERLVLLWGNVQRQKVERRGASYPDYRDWKAQAQSFDGIAAFDPSSFTLTEKNGLERINGESVSAGYFELLGVQPVAGRTIRPDEDGSSGGASVILIRQQLWNRLFGSEQWTPGKQLQLNRRQFTVVGVMPGWFHGLGDEAELWLPFTTFSSPDDLSERGNRGFAALARMKSGVQLRQAQVEMDSISKRLEQMYPASNARRGVEVAPLSTELVGELRTPLLVLLGAVGFVLLVACANVANLFLARSESRRQEIAIRAAMGASRIRILQQLLTESILLAISGAALGLVLAFWAVRLLTAASPISLPTFVNPQVDATAAALAVILSVGAGITVGIAPALQAGRRDVSGALKESSSRSGEHVTRQRVRSALVISEVAVAMTLLVAAGLLMRSFLYVAAIRPGFDPKGVLTMKLSIPRNQAPVAPSSPSGADQRTLATARRLIQRVAELPSVESASLSFDFPFSGNSSAIFYSAEGQPVTDAQTRPRAYRHAVSPEFFSTLRTPFFAGRAFTEAEMGGQDNVVIVTENLVRRFWPGQDPIGKHIKSGGPDSPSPWWTIIGVVREMKFRGLPENPTADPDLFLPLFERQPAFAMLVRSSLDSSRIAGAVRNAVLGVDASIVVYDSAPLVERMNQTMERSSFSSWMMSVFACLALTLASVGLYGLMSYTVRQRTREFGIRIAMGATSSEVTGMVIRRGMVLVAAGVGIGCILASALARVLRALLFGISHTDLMTFAGVAVVLAAVGLIACYLPARRASRVDPMTALRYE